MIFEISKMAARPTVNNPVAARLSRRDMVVEMTTTLLCSDIHDSVSVH